MIEELMVLCAKKKVNGELTEVRDQEPMGLEPIRPAVYKAELHFGEFASLILIYDRALGGCPEQVIAEFLKQVPDVS